ncbi:hypothetical protein Acr_00g0024330 [Actinidia rufa]|uniref:Uncharacterized protein n=1 Tax=Actinidia rufa TaxID=165716 RepID=A0A7J0DEW8_9ERIC|nr:hypothetical protein Acr_00g0024330 [Actinidia rufa]
MAPLTYSLRKPSVPGRNLFRRSLPSLAEARRRNELRILCSNSYPPNKFKRAYTSVMIVPTGIGASIGGFAGDALPVARALASVVDCLISHPNVGLVLDAGIEEELCVRHLQVVDATRASLGLPVVEYAVTDTPLQGIDILAGVEAIISHLVVKEFQIPCAHAPALLPLPLSMSLCPKSAAEEMGYTFLPCVLAGLSNAPQYVVKNFKSLEMGCISANDVDSVILPADACGGDGVLAFANSKMNKPLIITVEENETVLSDTAEKVGIEAIKVSNYWEAIGVIVAHKAGIDPNSLRKNRISKIQRAPAIPFNGYGVSSASVFVD